jgi:hypothetical protein
VYRRADATGMKSGAGDLKKSSGMARPTPREKNLIADLRA